MIEELSGGHESNRALPSSTLPFFHRKRVNHILFQQYTISAHSTAQSPVKAEPKRLRISTRLAERSTRLFQHNLSFSDCLFLGFFRRRLENTQKGGQEFSTEFHIVDVEKRQVGWDHVADRQTRRWSSKRVEVLVSKPGSVVKSVKLSYHQPPSNTRSFELKLHGINQSWRVRVGNVGEDHDNGLQMVQLV